MQIADIVPSTEQAGMAYAIQHALNEWQPDSYDAMADFLAYIKPLLDSDVPLDTAVGAWVWVNLERHDHANSALRRLASSLELVAPTGHLLIATFHNWYQQLECKT